ncbi:MAG: chloride channel protein [Dethiobacteraceae bacterium]
MPRNFTALLIPDAGHALTALLTVTGMAASLAGVANVPIATSVMLIEMVGLSMGVPASVGSIIGYAIARNKVIYNPDNGNQTDIKLLREKDCERGH